MSRAWVTIAALAVTTALVKGLGPAVLGGRPLPPVARRVIALLAPALLAGLVITDTFAGDRRLVLDPRAAGLAAAAACIAAKAPLAVTVIAAAIAAAVVRAVT